MATVSGGTVTIDLTYEELEAIKRALKVADTYEYDDLWKQLSADLGIR